MKSIRFFKYALWAVVLFLFANSVFSVVYAATKVNGKLTFVIEKKSYSQQEAVDLINNRTPILLKVSLRMEGDWYTMLKAGKEISINQSQFSFATVKDGGLKADYNRDPAVYILSNIMASGTNCTDASGNSLCYRDIYPSGLPKLYISSNTFLQWFRGACPHYAYELIFTASDVMTAYPSLLHENVAEQYYEIDLFYLPFILKRAETVYVRGIDGVRYDPADEDNNIDPDGGAAAGATELNLVDGEGSPYIPSCNYQADWTGAEDACYGGVLPGGIFIEQVPELTQFEPKFPGSQKVFCDGDDITLTATVKYPTGKKRNEYTMELWWKDDYQTGAPRTALAVLDGRNNSATGHCVSGGTDCVTMTTTGDGTETNTTFAIKVPRAIYDAQTANAGLGETDHLKKFTFVVHETGASNGAGTSGSGSGSSGSGSGSGGPVTRDTTAETADLPKIYLNVKEGLTALTGGVGVARTAASPVDKIEGIMNGTTIALRNDCDETHKYVSSKIDYNCYWNDGAQLSSDLYFSNVLNGPYYKATNEVGSGQSAFATGYTLASGTPLYYYNQLKWTNGCITQTDTVLIEPGTVPPAPSITIQNYDCGTNAQTFDMYAEAPDKVTPDEWQWVIRHEWYGSTANGPGGKKTNSCLTFPSPDNDPLKAPQAASIKDVFLGGVIFDKDHGMSYSPTFGGVVNYSVSVVPTADKKRTDLKVTSTGGDKTYWSMYNSLFGSWMPDPSVELTGKTLTGSFIYNNMSNKWVYVRYKVGNQWSDWAAEFTREQTDPYQNGPADQVKSWHDLYAGSMTFSIGRKGNGTNDDRPGPKFNGYAATCDTMIERGQPLQLYFTVTPELNSVPLSLESDLLWQVSTDNGTTWTTWATTPKGTPFGGSSAPVFNVMLNGSPATWTALAAPSLRYPMQDEQYRIIYVADCEDDEADRTSDNSGVLNVTMLSSLRPGKIEATVDGTVHDQFVTLCGDAVRLELKNFTAGASLQWEEMNALGNFQPISGATNSYLDLNFDLQDLITANDKTTYDNGGFHTYQVTVTLDGESKTTAAFGVIKNYVLSSDLAVTTAKAETSGVCGSSPLDFKATFKKPWIYKDAYSLEMAYPDQDFVTYASGTTENATAVTFNIPAEYVAAFPSTISLRIKNEHRGCTAYSDTVKVKIVKVPTAAGTLVPDSICPDRDETVEFQSTDGNYFDWAYYEPSSGSWQDLTAHTRTVTLNIPASAFTGDPAVAGIRVTPYARQTVGSDVTSCPGDAQMLALRKGSKCDVGLSLDDPNQSEFCANDLQDVKINITPNQAKTKTFALQWKQSANDADYASVANDMFTWTENASNEYTSLTVKAAFFNGKTVGTKIDFRLVVTEGTVVTNSSVVSVTLKPLPTFGAKTIMMAPSTGVCAGTDLTIGTALTPTTGTSGGYTWIYASSAADTLAGARIFHDLPTVDHSASGQALTLKKTDLHRNEMVGRFYGVALTATLNGCTAHDTSYFLAPVIHPLPDTAGVVTGATIGGQAVSELYTCAGKGTTMEVTTDGDKVPSSGSFTYSWTKGGGALPSGVTKTDLASDAGSRLTFSDAAATTANSGTYTLSLTVTTDKGCALTLKRDLKIHFETCGKDKVSDGAGTEYTATKPFVLCANDATWPSVQIEAADLTDGAAGTAKVTKITLYHSTAADMTGEAEVTSATPPANNNPPLKTLTFDVDAAATAAQYKTPGSHYYRGKIERDGYAPTYTDIVEYVIGAVPVRTLTGGVQASSYVSGLTAEIDAPTADLKVCAGLVVELKLSATPANGSLTEAGGLGGDYKWYRNASLSASTTAPDDPAGLTAVAGSNATTSLGAVAAGGANDGLYFAYRQYIRETAIHTGSVSAKQCTTLVKVPEGAKVQVKPMPSKPTGITGETKNLCDGDAFNLTTVTTPASATDGATWTYRWYKRANGTSDDKPFNPANYGTTLPNLDPIALTASVGSATSTITDLYKLKVYTVLDGCYDSTALLGDITVKIASRPSLTKPTVTPSLTGGAVCAGSSLTLTAATTPTPSGATLHYRWFKLKGATADTLADAPPVGTDAATYTINPAAAANAGQYYVRVLAVSGNCSAKALSDLTKVTVKPLPAPTYVQKIDGVAQTNKSVCKESEPTLLVEASVSSGSPTYSYAWQSPASGTASSYKVPQSATASEGTLTYPVKVKATENGCSSAEQTLTFTVKVVDCSNDLIEDGHSKGFEVCAGETAAGNWPTVKITANDHAGADIDWIELYHHTANSATGGTLIAKLTPAAGNAEATLEFAPFSKTLTSTPSTTLTPSFGTIDFKAPSSTAKHFYYAKVSRSGGTDVKTTAVAEYMVGALPDKDVVLGTGANTVGILLSEKATLADAKANGDDNTLTLCAGQGAYLHLNNLPSAATLTAANTTLTQYDWYRNTSAYSGTPIPDDPTGMGTRFGSAATETLAAVTGISAQQKDYYYAYLSYETSTAWVTAGKSAKVCKATYAVQTEAVRTVNPLPSVPSVTDGTDQAVCESATFNLTANLNPAVSAKPADVTWTYRWYYTHNGGAQTQIDPDPATDAWGWGANNALTNRTASAAGATSEVMDTYYIKVRAENTTTHCVDSIKTPVKVQTVKVTPKPKFTAAPKLSTNDLTVCAEGSGSVTVTPNLATAPDATPAYQWYKLQDGYSTPETGNTHAVLLVGKSGATLSFSNIAAADAGKYYVVVTATPTSATGSATGCTEVRQSDVVTVTVNLLPDVTFTRKINGVERNTLKTCTGETVELELVPDATAFALNHTYAYTWPTATVDNITPSGGSGNSTDGGSKAKVKASVMASTGSNTVTVSPIRVTTQKSCWKEYTGTQFTVIVSDCSKDEVLEPGDGGVDIPRSKTEPFSVCAGEKAWPAVKINAGNHADQIIESMDLYHRHGTTGAFAKVASATLAADAKEGDLTFAPLTAAVGGQDFKQAGSHYYFALVKRDDGSAAGQILSTDTVEYVVGAMPSKAVVSGGTIALSLTNGNGPATGDGTTLTLCAGPNTYLYTNNLPTTLDGGETTYGGATWYQGKSGQVSPIPDEPSATAMTSLGTGDQAKHDQKDLGATSGITAAKTDYYYAYLKFSRETTIHSTTANLTCDTVYPLASEGVRTVNPMPDVTISMDAQTKSVCDGESVTLAPVNLTAKPAGDTWTYRWFKDGKAFAPAYSNAAAATASHTFTASNTTTSSVDEVYTLKVYAETAAGCQDSALLANGVKVRVAPQPTATPSVPVIEPAGTYATKADGEIYVCEGNTMKLQLKPPFTTVPSGSEYVKYHWYKVDGATETKLKSGEVYTSVDESLNYLNITKAQETDATNGVHVAGDYKLVVRVSVNSSCYKDFTSDPVTLGFGKRPVLQVTASTAKEFTLCPGEETTFGVQLDAATQAESGVAIDYQWYKDGKAEANKIAGATSANLTVKADDLSAGPYTYYVKITKSTPDAYNCPTEIWSDMAVSADNTKNGGMGVPFKLTRRASCSKDEIVEGGSTNPPVMSKLVASAICLSEAETGKMFRIKASTGRLSINKVSWHYAPVTENGTQLALGTAQDGPVCTDEITSGNIGCAFNTNTVAAMKAVGEWAIWADIERSGANPISTDTIHFVVRPNPTLTNESDLKVVLLQLGTGTEIDPAFVCDGTKAQLAETPAPVLNGLTDLSNEKRTDSVGYDWLNVTTGGSGIQKSTDKVWEILLSQRKAAPASYSAPTPAGAAYQDDYTLTQIYQRRYERNTAAYPHAGLPTYNIACKVMDGTAVKQKVLRKTTYASVKPRGSVTDGAASEKADYCTAADLSTPLALTFTPAAGDQYKAAQVTVWNYASSDNGAAWVNKGAWATVTDGTAQAAANQLSVSLTDANLTQPASGKTMAYKFWAQVRNGQCEDSVGGYVLTFYGAPVAGGLEVPATMCADGATFAVKATKVKPANAQVTFYAYDGDPTTGSPNQLATKTITASGSGDEADVQWQASVDIPDLKAGRYYFRYKVADPNKVCTEVWSGVKYLDLAPNPTLTDVALDKAQLCLESGAQVTLTFNATDVAALKIYASDANLASGVQAILDAVTAGTAKEIHAATDAEVSAKSVTLTYDGNNMYVDPSKGANSQTYFYAIGTQDKSGSLTGACASTSAKVALKTGKPVTDVTIEWSDETEAAKKLDLGQVELGTTHHIGLTGGDNGDKKTLYSDATENLTTTARWSNAPSAYPYNFTATPEGKLYVWAIVTGYNGCPSKTSNSIQALVIKSQHYAVTGDKEVCAEGDIELSIDENSSTVGIAATPYPVKWLYKLQSASGFTEVPSTATVGGSADNYKLTWPSALSTAGTYVFRMAYTNDATKNRDTTHPYTVTVHAKPTLSNTTAPLNLPHPICDGESFDIKLASGVTMSDKLDLLFGLDAAESDLTKWTPVAQDKGATFTYPVDGLSDSGYYRVRVYSHASCDPIVSDPQLLAVNSKPVAGTLALTPGTACFGTPVDVALTGYTGQIAAYEYTADRAAADNATAPAAPADNEMAWRPVTAAPATYPIAIPDGFAPDADGDYPDAWTLKSVKHGYKLRAKVTNGACPPAYAATLVKIYDTVVVDQAPQSVTVNENAQHFPATDITFTSTGKWSGGKYRDGNTFETPPSAMKYQWRYRWDESKPWENFSGSGADGFETTTLKITPAYWTDNLGITSDLVKTVQFRMLIVSGDCKDTIRSTEAKINLQTPLTAGVIEVPVKNPSDQFNGKCFFYRDTVILHHKGASGQGTVRHHWMVGSTVDKDVLQTLDQAGFAYHYGRNGDGSEDRTTVYLTGKNVAPADMQRWWDENGEFRKFIHVIVTDDVHKEEDLFNADGSLKANPDPKYYADWEMCFRTKPTWQFPNDTICDDEQTLTLSLTSDVKLEETTPHIHMTVLRIATYRKAVVGDEWSYQNVVAINHPEKPSALKENSLTLNGETIKMKLLEKTVEEDGKTLTLPTGELVITAETPADHIGAAFDSLAIRVIVETNLSQTYDTLYSVLRIDQGIKEIKPKQAELTVCEGGTAELEAAVERYSASIPSEIKWKWQRRGTSGDATTDKDAGEAARFTGSTTKGVPDPVKLTLSDVKPEDSGIWVLKTETDCGQPKEQEFVLKVNVKPTWEEDLTIDKTEICAGPDALTLKAKLNVNWTPDITWEHAKTATGPWSEVAQDGTMTFEQTPTRGQLGVSLKIEPTYLIDSGYYRIKVKAADDAACDGFEMYSAVKHVHIDTTPQITLDKSKWELSRDANSDLTATVSNPKPKTANKICTESANTSTMVWRVLYTAGLKKGQPYQPSVTRAAFLETPEGLSLGSNFKMEGLFGNDDGSTAVLTLTSVPLALDSVSVFLHVDNCCGESYSDTILIRVVDNLALFGTTGDTVCEGTTAHLKASANMNIDDPGMRAWEYTTGADDDNWKEVPMAAWQATEDMKNSVSTLTVPNVPYSMDGYRFRFKVTDGEPKYSDPVATLVVRPVENLHVLVQANPNPASDYTGVADFNTTELEATVYVGDAPRDNTLPANAKVLDDEALTTYGYTVFDWYQIAPSKGTPEALKQVNVPNDASGLFATDATGDALHQATLKVKDLDYNKHDSTHYFAILRHACFDAVDRPNQADPADFDGVLSDTTTLRIYEDLIVEWAAADMYSDTLPYGTTPEELATWNWADGDPTDKVIGVHLENRNPANPENVKHWISSAYYITCGANVSANLSVELRKGIQSNDDDLMIATRQWFYRKDPADAWTAMVTDKRFGGMEDPDFGEIFDMQDGRRDLKLSDIIYGMNGWQFFSVALADSIGENADGSANYQYRDTTPVLTLVVSEPIPSDIAFEPDPNAGAPYCGNHDYTFTLSAQHETYLYQWQIKRPDDAGYTRIDTLDGKPAFHFGLATPADNGTLVRAIVSNYCGTDTVEAEIQIIDPLTVEVELSSDTAFCAGGAAELTATATNAGDNPTYAWFVNGEVVPEATSETYRFDPAAFPALAAGGTAQIAVRLTADPALCVVDPTVSDTATVTVYPLPVIDVTADETNLTVVDSTTVRVSGVEDGSTVSWTPADYLYTPDQPESRTKPIAASGSHWFTATVTSIHGCVVSDSVEIVVASSFTYDSTQVVVLIPPALPWLSGDGDGEGDGDKPWTQPDTNVNIMVVGDTLHIITCENSLVFLTLFTSGGDPTLVYEWDADGLQPLTEDELTEMGYAPLPDTMVAFYLDGVQTAFGCTITERDGTGLSVHMQGYISYYVTEHVALEALPHMRHNRYYEDQVIYLTAHPNSFEQYHFYRYGVAADELTGEQHGENRHYKTRYTREDGAEQAVYVAVADRHGCRSYDSVNLRIIALPNAIILNDPNYPEADVLFPEFEVEIHDSWGRMVKSMTDGLGWDGTYAGKQVEGGTYYYRVKLPTMDGYTYIKGAVTVFTKKK